MRKRFGDTLSPAAKYWLFLVGIVIAIFAVILGSFTASYLHLAPAEQGLVRDLFDKLLPFPFLGALLLIVIICTLVSLIFKYYILPVLRMAEQVRLITASNPDCRVRTEGARELRVLAEVVNQSADAYQALQREVDDRVRQANLALKEERNRFAALVSELPNGVVVCNRDGLIQLYNAKAQAMLRADGGEAIGSDLGLGRSIFGVLDRDPLVHALEVMSHGLVLGRVKPALGLMTKLCGERFIRVNLAPVMSREEGPTISGFVLTLDDITGEIEADSERDRQLQDLVDAVQQSLGRIHRGLETICDLPGVGSTACNRHRQAIATISHDLEEHLALARNLYSAHLKTYGSRENVLTDALLAIAANDLQERFGLAVEIDPEPSFWLHIDSYAVVQALATLAGQLKAEAEIERLRLCFAAPADGRGLLEITWPRQVVPGQAIRDWQQAPLFRRMDGTADSPASIIGDHGGEIRLVQEDDGRCRGVNLSLPAALTESTGGLHSPIASRPVSYEFDLFHQPGQEALGAVPLRKLTYVVFDTETTGLDPAGGDEIVQLGAIRIVNGRLLKNEIIDQLVDPRRPVPPSSVQVHGLDPEMLAGQPTIAEVLPRFHAFAEGAVLVAHNAAFDMRFLQLKQEASGVRFDNPVLDTLLLSSLVHPHQESHTLDAIAARFHLRIVGRHTAFGDALVTAEILLRLLPLLEEQGIGTLAEALDASAGSRFARLKY